MGKRIKRNVWKIMFKKKIFIYHKMNDNDFRESFGADMKLMEELKKNAVKKEVRKMKTKEEVQAHKEQLKLKKEERNKN
jgi:hypothetical protein